ncbi:MAG TPA: PAS domain S-box protein [Pyrinomonadaceae bacterium]|nr:PAS domain S-box protein [Pyrinomonadaceae bacterium]
MCGNSDTDDPVSPEKSSSSPSYKDQASPVEVVAHTRAAIERDRAESALRETEAKYRSLFDAIDEGFCVIEVLFDDGRPVDYRFLETNPAFERQTGLVNAIGRTVREFVPAHDAHWFQIYGRVALSGEPIRFEAPATALGRFYDVYAFRMGEPHEHRVAVLFNDITERRKADERQAYLLKLSDALRSLSNPASVKAAANRLLGEQIGADRVLYAEYVRKGDEDYWLIENVYHAPDYTFPEGLALMNSFGRDSYEVFKGNTVVINDVFSDEGISAEAKETFKEINVSAYVAVPLIKEGKFVALISVNQVTRREWKAEELDLIQETAERTWAVVERARAEEAMRRSEDRLRLLIESAEDYAIFTMTIDGLINYWNAGAERIFGYTEKEILGKSAAILFTPEDRERGVPGEEMVTAAAVGRASDERWHVNKKEERFYCSGVMTALRSGDVLRGFAKIARDLTAKKRAEERLQRAHNELDERVRARTAELITLNQTLVTEITERTLAEERARRFMQQLVTAQEDERCKVARDLHDHLGQQLTGLRLKLQNHKQSCGEDEVLRTQVEQIQAIAEQVDEDVDFLAWELMPASLDEFGLSVALANFVQEWSKHFETSAEFHSLGLDGERLPSEIEINLYRIAQEAMNNISKHADAEGVDVLLERRDSHLVLIVEDDGNGFDPDVVDAKTDGKRMGLLNMRERAAFLRGTVEIESQRGEGTTVFVRVPLPLEAPSAHGE